MGFMKKEKTLEQMKTELAELNAKIAKAEGLIPTPAVDRPIPPKYPKREHLFQMHGEVSRKMMDLKMYSNQLKNEQSVLSQETDGMMQGIEGHKKRMDQLRTQLERGAEELEELWIQINFECEYLDHIIKYATKSRERRDNLPNEIAKDKQIEEAKTES
jgi:hypothetical protein